MSTHCYTLDNQSNISIFVPSINQPLIMIIEQDKPLGEVNVQLIFRITCWRKCDHRRSMYI